MPKYFIKTNGYQINVNDSEMMAGLLEVAGYAQASSDHLGFGFKLTGCLNCLLNKEKYGIIATVKGFANHAI